MATDLNEPVTLVRVSTEAEAVAIANALSGYNVEAIVTGDYTTGFRAEAPGYAAVLVKRADLERAQAAWEKIQQQGEFDWTAPDVEAEVVAQEDEAQGGEVASPGASPLWQTAGNRLVWIVALIGVAVGVVVWLITGRIAALMIWAVAMLGVIALVTALNSLGRASQRSESDDTYTRGE